MIHLLALASPKASNQSLEPTAGRRVTSLFMTKSLAASDARSRQRWLSSSSLDRENAPAVSHFFCVHLCDDLYIVRTRRHDHNFRGEQTYWLASAISASTVGPNGLPDHTRRAQRRVFSV